MTGVWEDGVGKMYFWKHDSKNYQWITKNGCDKIEFGVLSFAMRMFGKTELGELNSYKYSLRKWILEKLDLEKCPWITKNQPMKIKFGKLDWETSPGNVKKLIFENWIQKIGFENCP